MAILNIILSGIAIGLSVSAPMGPTGALVVRRAINNGRTSALLTGMGAAMSDIIYTYITIYFSYLASVYVNPHRAIIAMVSALLLVLYGLYLYRSNPSRNLVPGSAVETTYWKDFVSGFLFTFANPLIIIFIITLMGTLNFLPPSPKLYHTIIGLGSVAVGALLWWYLLTLFIHRIRNHFNVRSIWLINRGIAIFILFLAFCGFYKGINYINEPAIEADLGSTVLIIQE